MLVDLNCEVVQSKDQVCAEMDGEVAIMSIQKGNYYCLDRIGGMIWERLAKPCRVSELCNALLGQYDVDREKCEVDVLNFLSEMETQGLIEVLSA